ncbi:MAG: hypothetical protein QOJ40_2626, partial [Verrucomicrobiota bacterium]
MVVLLAFNYRSATLKIPNPFPYQFSRPPAGVRCNVRPIQAIIAVTSGSQKTGSAVTVCLYGRMNPNPGMGLEFGFGFFTLITLMDCRFSNGYGRFSASGRALVIGGLISLRLLASGQENPLSDKPVVGKNADGYLEVFKVDSEGVLRHRWQRTSDGDWAAWSTLGSSFLPGIAVASNIEGEMEIFGVDKTTGFLKHSRQITTNAHEWAAWASLGGRLRGPLCVGQNVDGRLEVFAIDAAQGNLKHIHQTGEKGGWSEWSDLGGEFDSGFAVGRNRDGRLELFGIDAAAKTLVHRWQKHPSSESDWSDWSSLGGPIWPGFAMGQNVIGRLEVFAVNRTNNAMGRFYQNAASNSEMWSPWLDFGGPVEAGIAVGQSADGRLEVIAVSAENSDLLHRWETRTDGADQWSAWAPMGILAQSYPAAGQNEDGNLEVFAVDKTNRLVLNHKRQISRASEWLDWSSLDHSTFQYNSRTWQIDEGLPANVVQAITQTRDGYLWVGTPEGLARFDGVSFTSFNSKNCPALQNSSVTALCADRQGALWIGTDGGGLTRLEGASFSHYAKAGGIAGDTLRVVYESHDGSIWIGTTTGMSRYRNRKFTAYTTSDGLLSDVVNYIYEDKSGDLWIATGAGLNRLRKDKMEAFTMPNRLPNDSVRGICQDRGGRIWIGSNNGMLWYNWFWNTFYPYNSRYGLSDTFVSAILEDKEANLWVGTYSGLNRFREGRFFPEVNNEGLPFDRVNVLFNDQEGNLWVGSREGLSRLTPKRFVAYTKRQGLSHNNITSVLEDGNGSLWIGTWGGGLNQLKDEKVTVYAGTNFFSRDLILATCEGRDGALWIGADFDGGLTRLKDGKFKRYTWKDGLINAPVKVIHEDNSGSLWIGTTHGLSCLSNGKFTNYTTKDHLAGDAVSAICEDHEGALWFGTSGGLSHWKEGRFSNFTPNEGLSDEAVTALYEDQSGNLWIGTANGGLNRYRDKQFTAYRARQGLFSDEILEILEDDQGWLWMSSFKGIFRVRKQDLDDVDSGRKESIASIAYGKAEGIESTHCNGLAKPAGWKTHDGRLWFPTSKGLVSINPSTVTINQIPPPVYISQVIADKKPAKSSTSRGEPQFSVSSRLDQANGTLEIPPGRGELEFHYTALNLQAPENSRFRYKLEGVDLDWVDAGARRVAYYNNIPPGNYRFRVIASNKDGVWNQAGATLPLVLRPHLWQIWWLRALAALLVIGAAGATARYLTTKRMQRALERLEQKHALEKERGRIAKDIHDDLGSSLTRITMLGERAEEGLVRHENVEPHVRKIVASARHTVQSLDEIVWAVNPENDSLEGLVEYISHYADEFFEDTDVLCHLEIPVELPDVSLAAEVRHDLFLVVKEAF